MLNDALGTLRCKLGMAWHGMGRNSKNVYHHSLKVVLAYVSPELYLQAKNSGIMLL